MRLAWVSVFRCAFTLALLSIVAGCGNGGRLVAISTAPEDATLRIDDAETDMAPLSRRLRFEENESHTILASRFGYTDQERVLKVDPLTGKLVISYKDAQNREIREMSGDELRITLPPKGRKLTFKVTPVPAMLSLDGQLLDPAPVTELNRWIQFSVDADKSWVPHRLTAHRAGFTDVTIPIRWTDQDAVYNLALEPFRKDLHISARPAGAEILINGESRGAEPVTLTKIPFPLDPVANQFATLKITARKPGYDPVDRVISWDDGKVDYSIDLSVRTKAVWIATDPPGAIVKLDNVEARRDLAGASMATLDFPPADEAGTLRSYPGIATKKEGATEWESAPFQIGWDNGQQSYKITLQEVKTRQVTLVRPHFVRAEGGWQVMADSVPTIAPKDVGEPGNPAAILVYQLAGSGTIDSPATSPDGSQIVFSVLAMGPNGVPRSQIQMLDVEAGPTTRPVHSFETDQSLSLMPSFSPDARQVLFSSNREARDGKRMSIWTMPADRSAAPTRLTGTDSNDLWPTLDSLPHSRLFYARLLDGRTDSRLFVTDAKAGMRLAGTDLAQPGLQPRVSPKADSVLFAASSPATSGLESHHRYLCIIPDTGGQAVELTHPSDFDDFDAVWSKDASRVAFTSNRPLVKGGKAADYNIWVLDVAHPDSPVALTTSTAWDDSPAWDINGKTIYFRSNRGGQWGIWKASLK